MRPIVASVEVLTVDWGRACPLSSQRRSTFSGRLRGAFLVFPRTLALEPGVGGWWGDFVVDETWNTLPQQLFGLEGIWLQSRVVFVHVCLF